jgi:hypothetical protein
MSWTRQNVISIYLRCRPWRHNRPFCIRHFYTAKSDFFFFRTVNSSTRMAQYPRTKMLTKFPVKPKWTQLMINIIWNFNFSKRSVKNISLWISNGSVTKNRKKFKWILFSKYFFFYEALTFFRTGNDKVGNVSQNLFLKKKCCWPKIFHNSNYWSIYWSFSQATFLPWMAKCFELFKMWI